MIFPVAEIRDEVLANFARGIDAEISIEQLLVLHIFERRQRDGKQDPASFPALRALAHWQSRFSTHLLVMLFSLRGSGAVCRESEWPRRVARESCDRHGCLAAQTSSVHLLTGDQHIADPQTPGL